MTSIIRLHILMSFYASFFSPEIFVKKTGFPRKIVVKGLAEIFNSRMRCPRAKPIGFWNQHSRISLETFWPKKFVS